MTRRDFIAASLRLLAVVAAPGATLALLSSKRRKAPRARKTGVRYAFLVDTEKCVGCGMCVQACKLENGVPLDASVSRTWIERYVVTKDGKVFADTPHAGQEGFLTSSISLGKGHTRDIPDDQVAKAFFVPKLCNQCENPPCVQVCPVGATYQTAEGIALVDRETCIGCGYCIMACPYGARFFHPKYKVAEKCTFCNHRLAKGMQPACVEACAFGARMIGNLEDPEDPLTRAVRTERLMRLKEEYGCEPQVYYRGLSREVR